MIDSMSETLIDADISAAKGCFEAAGLAFSYPDAALLAGLSFTIQPGLTLLRGGSGRGKRTLLRLIAGELIPHAGLVLHRADPLYWENPADPACNDTVARDWLAARRCRFARWQEKLAAQLIEGFGLAGHIDKPMYMLSTGSRRKVGLVAAAASEARLTLLDRPFSALDASSCHLLTQLLAGAAQSRSRAWVIADYELPSGLAGLPLAGVIDLGD